MSIISSCKYGEDYPETFSDYCRCFPIYEPLPCQLQFISKWDNMTRCRSILMCLDDVLWWIAWVINGGKDICGWKFVRDNFYDVMFNLEWNIARRWKRKEWDRIQTNIKMYERGGWWHTKLGDYQNFKKLKSVPLTITLYLQIFNIWWILPQRDLRSWFPWQPHKPTSCMLACGWWTGFSQVAVSVFHCCRFYIMPIRWWYTEPLGEKVDNIFESWIVLTCPR